MENKVFLNIDTTRGLVVIPFDKLRDVDLFTEGYDNETELIESLNNILDLSLDISEVINIYISGRRFELTRNSSLSHIKYSSDNYNLDSLKSMLSLYLKQDHRRIRYCDVRFVQTRAMIDFNAGNPISDNDIDAAVSIYLESGYKKERDMYFMIKDFATIKTDKLTKEERTKENISKMHAEEDSVVQYFIELASRDNNMLEKALDELSKLDLEEISKALDTKQYAPVDGLATPIIKDDEYEHRHALEVLTGLDIHEIKELQIGFQEYQHGYSR